MNNAIDVSIDPDEPKCYTVVALGVDPRSDETEDCEPVSQRENQSRIRALQFAQSWKQRGHWTAVINQGTGEIVKVYEPVAAHAPRIKG